MIKIFKPKQLKSIILLAAGFALFPTFTLAAVLYLEPSQGEYQPGDNFIINVRIDTEGECINTVEANLSFPKDILRVADFSQGKSIITLWVKPPEINQEEGLVSFSGGIPGGYCGIIPGDPETTNLLGKIIFRVPGMIVGGAPEALIKIEILETSQVFLNDGLGTLAKLTTQGAAFEIVPTRAEPLEEDWYQEIEEDTTPPELFEIEIHQESAIFEGKYFITFFTTDKQTGLDYYEIKEGDNDWKRATSPYLLADQSLQSIIKVKAVDKAGNERVAEYLPAKRVFPYWIIILILLSVGVGYWFYRKFKNRA